MNAYDLELALSNCAREQIHKIQLIQPHGFLLAFELNSGRIRFASDNVAEHLTTQMDVFLNSSIYDYLHQPQDVARNLFENVRPDEPKPIEINFKDHAAGIHSFEVLAHSQDDLIVIEAMPLAVPTDHAEIDSKLETVLNGLSLMHSHKSLPVYLHECAAQIQAISGYQRVLIYRFLPDWSGEVIAESVLGGHEPSYVGLRFPASDIPPQARELYKKNLLRIIGDVQAAPIRIRSVGENEALDQSHSLLRSPSDMHRQYLGNMGVRATMTISMMKNGELWGMVACHHDQPMTPPVSLRRATKVLCALVTESAVIKIDALVSEDEQLKSRKLDELIQSFKKNVNDAVNFQKGIEFAVDKFSSIVNYSDWGVIISGKWIRRPEIPDSLATFIEEKIQSLGNSESFFNEKMSEHCRDRTCNWENWAGIALLPLATDHQSHIFFLRPPLTKEVVWAGKPAKDITATSDGQQVLSPRASFSAWTQLVEDESEQWTDVEKFIIHRFAKAIDESYLRSRERLHQENLRLLGSCMASLNDMVLVTDTSSVDEPGPTIVYANEALFRHTGYEPSEVVGKTPRIFQGPKTDPAELAKIRQALIEWRSITVEIINYKKNGEEYWVEITITPIADSTGWFTHWVSVQRDIGERKRNELNIQKLVYYDVLTGLPNRRLLMDRLRVAIANAKRFTRSGALMFIDLDHFKNLNDTAGHHVGDELLRQVAIRLSTVVRKQDMVARLGGDEFVVLLEGLSHHPTEAAATAKQLAEKLINCLDKDFELPDRDHNCSGSLGISLFGLSNQTASEDELIKQADFAMYQAKAAGRNIWRFFDPDTQAALVKRSALESDLKNAFAENKLLVYFQPIVGRDKASVGVEALLRWFDSQHGWISPADFIPIAEQNGMIIPIGKWVLSQSCLLLASWSKLPAKQDWTVSVNVSARQIKQDSFVKDVVDIVNATSCDPSLLKLEITESLLQDDFEATVEKMKELRTYGIRFSIDDFGTGYSSLTYLRMLPISILKIDRSFVNRLTEDQGDRAICLAILSLGKTLGLEVVAEGVEVDGQFNYLFDASCDYFQGFLFGKAIAAESL